METYLWPIKGGSWKERFLGAAMLTELLLLWWGYYTLVWVVRH